MQAAAKADVVIETERLILRRHVPEDFAALRRLHTDPELMWVYGGVFSEADTHQWIKRNLHRYVSEGVGFWAIVLKDTGELIGSGGLVYQETDRGTELECGYQVRRDLWGHGYATEMARACIQYAFDHLGAEHVISLIRPNNRQSRRVAEKNGLVADREIVWREMPHLVYTVCKVEWKTRQERSEGTP